MDTLLTEEELMVKNLAREFLEGECPTTLVREMETDDLGYPPDFWRQIADLGWFGMAIPEEYGGQGLPVTYLGLVMGEVGRAIAPVPFHSNIVPALTIASDGTEEQRQEILPPVNGGDLILSWALTERDARLMPDTVQTSATADGDHYVINGTKLFVESFNAAHKCLVVCRTAPASASNEGISLFLVDTKSPGISHTLLNTTAKDKQSDVVFSNVRVPKANLVGELNQGWPVVERMLERAILLLCAQTSGAARKMTEMAIEYTKSRVAFGRPIGAFQSVSHMVADMVMWVDGVDLLTFEGLWRLAQGLPAAIEASQAKAFCNDKCQHLGLCANNLHGGLSFMKEYDLQLWFRRMSAWTMRLGTSFEHRAKVADAILQPGFPLNL